MQNTRPRVLCVVDVRGSSLWIVAHQLQAGLAERFDVSVVAYADVQPGETDLLVCFWWGVLQRVKARVRARRTVIAICDHLSWNASDVVRRRLAATLRGAHRVVTADDAAGRALSDQIPLPISICPDGVDTERFTPAPFPEVFTAGWCGATDRIAADGKGLAILKEACIRAGVPLRIQNAAEQRLPHEAMPAWHAGNSIYLCGSNTETTPLPVLEALATGRPVIGTAVGQIPHVVIPGETGLVVERSVEGFVRALREVRGWHLGERVEACRVMALTRSLPAMVDAWRDAMERTLDMTPVVWPSPLPDSDAPPALSLRGCRIVGADNGLGLSRDREIVARLFRAEGFDTALASPEEIPSYRVAVQVFLETFNPSALAFSEQTIAVPNPELWNRRWNPWLTDPRVTVWAKTEHGAAFFRELGAAKVVHVGFTSEDRLLPDVPRERRFLHLGGKFAGFKGTDDLLSFWRDDFPPLTILCSPSLPLPDVVKDNVTIRRERLSDDELRYEQNRHAFHVVPSRWEGFGHNAWEGLSTGAVVLHTELPALEGIGIPIPSTAAGVSPIGGMVGRRFAPEDLAWAVESAVHFFDAAPDASKAEVRSANRRRWEDNNERFRTRGRAAIDSLKVALEPAAEETAAPPAPVLAMPDLHFEALPFGEAPRPFERLVTVQSPHLRCGIAEYGRQLDAAFLGAGVVPETHRLDGWERAIEASTPGAVVLVHYEPALVGGDLRERLKVVRARGARAVLCCHWFDAQVLADYGPLVDRVVVHRDYGIRHEALTIIPLGCPAFEPPADRAALRRGFGHRDGQVVVTTAGFLTAWKQMPGLARALLQRWPHGTDVKLQFLTPLPFTGDSSNQEQAMRRVLQGMDPDKVTFSIDFRPEQDLLERLHASDLGFVFHGQHTGSVSAATKQFVSARTPVVTTGSSHASDLAGGAVKVDSFSVSDFARVVWEAALDGERLQTLRAGAEAEYERLSMASTAARYVELFRTLA